MNDGGLAGPLGRPESRRKVRGLLDRRAEAPERARIGGKIRIAQLSARYAARIFALLVHPDRPVKTVVGNDDDDRGIKLDRGGEVLAIHEEIAVAAERNHGTVRIE